MHELGLCDALLRMVDGIVAEEKLTAVHKITLEIGELSGVVPRFMTDCWTAVADGTRYAQTALVIETVPPGAKTAESNSASIPTICAAPSATAAA